MEKIFEIRKNFLNRHRSFHTFSFSGLVLMIYLISIDRSQTIFAIGIIVGCALLSIFIETRIKRGFPIIKVNDEGIFYILGKKTIFIKWEELIEIKKNNRLLRFTLKGYKNKFPVEYQLNNLYELLDIIKDKSKIREKVETACKKANDYLIIYQKE